MTNNPLHQELIRLQKKRVFFGHQSVGANILNGLKEIVSQNDDINLRLVSADTVLPEGNSFFTDAKIGRNTDPVSKCNAFTEYIDKLSGKIDIALMKFCYVDITSESHIDSVFNKYQSTIQLLRNKYPHIIFVHATVPLTLRAGGIKQFIKSLLGYSSKNDLDNIKRNNFNALLTEKFRDEPIFDLAGIESTYPDGKRESFEYEGKVYYSLIKDYTNDGGHLNKTGSKLAATNLIEILAGSMKVN